MVIEVKIYCDANRASTIVQELRAQGLVIGRDFDWAYNQYKYDWFGGGEEQFSHTIFTFYREDLATMFSLKYL